MCRHVVSPHGSSSQPGSCPIASVEVREDCSRELASGSVVSATFRHAGFSVPIAAGPVWSSFGISSAFSNGGSCATETSAHLWSGIYSVALGAVKILWRIA